MAHRPRLLLATTTWWPSLAVLASACEQAGFDVVMLCPAGHAGFAARRFACSRLNCGRPGASLLDALDQAEPALVVPGDERMVVLLRQLHAEVPRWRRLVEQAIGAPFSHDLLTARVPLLEAAATAGFQIPETRSLHSDGDLEAWLRHVPPPWVFKVDGAWGGEGVRIVSDRAAAHRAVAELRRGIPFSLALRRRIINGDPFPWRDREGIGTSAVSAQVFVPGRPGNCAVFARDGAVLGATVVEAMATCGEHGPSTLVEAVDRPDLVAAATRLVAQRGLSGFLGFDFVVNGAGEAFLIEMNPRITMPCRMHGPFGRAPIAAAAETHGAIGRGGGVPRSRTVFASFPLAWAIDPKEPALAGCSDDLPWHEPAMLRDALRPLWPERGILASLPARVRAFVAAARGRSKPDYRRRSFAWWLNEGGLALSREPVQAQGPQTGTSPEFDGVEFDAPGI